MNKSVIGMIEATFKSGNRLAAMVGLLLGGIVPASIFWVAHYEILRDRPLYSQISTYFVLGGLIFSAKTVYEWCLTAYGSKLKAFGFVLLIEGIMTCTEKCFTLSCICLAFLVSINAIATACNLVGDWQKGRETALATRVPKAKKTMTIVQTKKKAIERIA